MRLQVSPRTVKAVSSMYSSVPALSSATRTLPTRVTSSTSFEAVCTLPVASFHLRLTSLAVASVSKVVVAPEST